MVIKISKHFINNLSTFKTLNKLNIYEKLKLINNLGEQLKKLYTCLIMLIKALFYKKNFKML